MQEGKVLTLIFLNRLPRFLFTAKRHQMQVMHVLTKMTEKLKLTFVHSLYPIYGSSRVFIKNIGVAAEYCKVTGG